MNCLKQGFTVLSRSRPLPLSSAAFSTTSTSASSSIYPRRLLPVRRVMTARASTFISQRVPQVSASWQVESGPRSYSADANSNSAVKERLDKLVKNNKVVIFMKGVPDEPKCGFSNAVVQVLRMHGVTKYDSHDVLQDESIRQGIKDYTNWPTIPQVFINGEFVGGCDILIEMHKNGELVEQLSKVGIKSALLEQDGNKKKE